MQGTSLSSVVLGSPSYTGITVPPFVQKLDAHTPAQASLTKLIDVSAVLAPPGPSSPNRRAEIRVAILNRSATESFDVPIRFAHVELEGEIEVHEVYHEDLKAANTFESEQVKTATRREPFSGSYRLKAHSFQSEAFYPVECFLCVADAFVCVVVLIFHVKN